MRQHIHDESIIRHVPFFSSLSNDETVQVEQLIRKKSFTKDQIVLQEEETSHYMYLVYSGKVRVVKMTEEGREQIITIHRKNDFFGEMALLDGKTAPATIIAHEDAVIGLLSKEDFERHLLSNELINRKIITLLCGRLREAWAMIKILGFDSAEQRLMAVLDRLQELNGIMDDGGVIINVKLTHQQLANYTSVTRETITRMLKRFEKEGVIEITSNRSILLTKQFYLKLKQMR
ncbi:Crp/Fnr family transcriptional regulator [Pelotalea chapellei]|uniref:Crp/Fnr family transcriptional regulator n=1 Tax=Pelotalea chapellei TaxID=44671 RepID=A0ABS5U3P1_9BACT|nr:Crp/Fnr family transcriptional regulator [Pelotalea chapellei]MBT1070288.1 Crp/Fnr family transcriptional regulator [Pelotalea chapellei]